MAQAVHLTRAQRTVVLTAWATYACFYLGRLNLSIALPALASTLHASRAEVGILGTVFFWTYGLGTLVSGELGNRFRPRVMVALGLLTIVVVNISFSMQSSLAMMAVLWGMNGLAQSTGWSPLMRVIADHLNPPQRLRVASLFPISFQIGAASTWVLTGWLIAGWGWQAAFLVPGLLLCVPLAYWWISGIDGQPQALPFDKRAILGDVKDFALLLLANGIAGFVIVGMVLWVPTYVVDTGYVGASAVGIVSASLPLVGIAGMLMSNTLTQRSGNAETAAAQLLSGGILLCLMGAVLPLPVQTLALLAALTALGGLGGLMTSAIPVQFAKAGRVSSTTGILNGAFNLGGGFAGVLVGAVLEAGGWQTVLLAWTVALTAALILIWAFRHGGRRAADAPPDSGALSPRA